MVFTEFLEMVEEKYSPAVADSVIERSELPSGGAYTTLGIYDHKEMLQLVTHLAAETGSSKQELMRAFGEHLFTRFLDTYPQLFAGIDSALDFLRRVEDYIHVEVRKLYPDAELPSFQCWMVNSAQLSMTYRSKRPFAALAEGLIRGCIDHFDEHVDLEITDLSDGDGTAARFMLTRQDPP